MSKLRANSWTNKQTFLTKWVWEWEDIKNKGKQVKLQSLGIKHIATSWTSLVDNTNAKRAKGKQKSQTDNDVDYVSCCNDADLSYIGAES